MLQDAKLRAMAAQVALVTGMVALVVLLVTTAARNLELRGIPLGFGFLWDPANFQIAETVVA